MTSEIPKQSLLDMVRPELRDLAESCVGQFDPESALGQDLIAAAYRFSINFGQHTSEERGMLAGEAAYFEEQAWRRSSPNAAFRIIYLREAVSLYSIAGNKMKIAELSTFLKNS